MDYECKRKMIDAFVSAVMKDTLTRDEALEILTICQAATTRRIEELECELAAAFVARNKGRVIDV